LEHEFGKTRAYRSIRELLDGPAGALLPDLKPIWLMSPLSVADILPLDRAIFDVVIFDEASQIPVEDAIPTLVRAPQVIVVGDEKQLPPTNFFGASAADEDFDAENEDPDFELAQDSFLALAGERLSSVMLSWHYRSRAEELIGFSNAAFYRERLLTIPSTYRLLPKPPITVPDPTKPPLAAAELRARPVSFHHLPHGLYSTRRNMQEAVYIARLLRDLLAEGSGKTFGIVAFSEAQQAEIEAALAALALEDAAFSRQLEQERDRTEDGEFIGLFVKNLENVQGDERDVIILSICYAPDHSGKMRMNFGPINKMGGERRLNVIFSRAKENMVIVSSITSDAITNDYNLGANTLKTFLRYAETLSVGDEAGARIALRRISSAAERAEGSALDVARSQIADRLRTAGIEVREGLGLSSFTVDLALRAPGADRHQTAVLLDSALRYREGGLDELLLARASLLERAGWRVVTVPLKDWWQDPDRVIATILAAT
ncbi:AAA domain-containing protein, partial [Tabrizicola sp.]|uniref:AAA domain-containing protein n=1 Tax=Tabrizicola sp. TaxID=2005166 RepID=UPI003F317EE1